MIVEVDSKTKSQQYKIQRMSEYDIETSMDIPADHFNIIIENPLDSNGEGFNSELFNPNDSFLIKDNDITILEGISDDVTENWGENGSRIEIDGRDKSMLLIENDAEPKTYYKLRLSEFIKTITSPYGFSNIRVNSTYDKVIDKIVVEVGESEWDIILRETKKLGMWLWCEPDSTIVADVLNYDGEPSYTFSNTKNDAIKIKSFAKKKKGADIKSNVWIRGFDSKSFITKYQDSELVAQGYKRRMILEDGDADSRSKAEDIAKKAIDERKRGSFEIELTIHGKHNIQLNKTAFVEDKITKTTGVFFIVGIRHKKNDSVGNEKIIRLRPLWEGL